MNKDKLITVRINEDIYNQFKVWTESNNSNISKCLRDYIFNCLNLTQYSQNIDGDIDSNSYRQLENEVKKLSSQVEQLEDSLYSQLYSRLVNKLSSQNIDNSIDNSLSSQNIDNSIDSINTAPIPDKDKLEISIIDNILTAVKQKEDITAEITLSESPILPLNEDLGKNISNEEISPNNSDIDIVETEKVETHENKKVELTDKQKEVMINLDNIPSGEKLSYNALAKTLGVSRSVLESFELWQSKFTIEPKEGKKKGFDYTKN